MRKYSIAIFLVVFAFLALSLESFASVTLENKTGEYLKLEIKTSGGATYTSIDPRIVTQVGGNASTTIIVKSGANEKLCEGTFNSGDYVIIKKSGNSYILKKKK